MNELRALRSVVRGACDGRLTAADCRHLACVLLVETAATAGLALTTVPRVRQILTRIRPAAAACLGTSTEARILRAVDASARWRIGRATCLARALAAEILLPQNRRPQRIVIGVAPPAGGLLKSHAWIERDGRVLVGGGDSRREYVPLVEWDCRAR